jgi:hypothetical protein
MGPGHAKFHGGPQSHGWVPHFWPILPEVGLSQRPIYSSLALACGADALVPRVGLSMTSVHFFHNPALVKQILAKPR